MYCSPLKCGHPGTLAFVVEPRIFQPPEVRLSFHLIPTPQARGVSFTLTFNPTLPSLQEMCKGLSELTADQYGRKVLLHLLTPRSPRHFPPQYVALLSPGDGNAHSKKAAAVRSKELLEGVATTLLSFASAHVLEWAQNTAQAPLLLEMATSLPGTLETGQELVC